MSKTSGIAIAILTQLGKTYTIRLSPSYISDEIFDSKLQIETLRDKAKM